jgi:nitrogen fixation protein NifU and related proteins
VLYTEKVMDHFNNPRNVGVIEDADGTGEVGNPTCGDIMKITISVDDTDHIDDIKFQTLGCGAAIATSSIVTEMARGMSLDEAVAISKQQVADELGGLPPAKMHCSVLATDGLKVAVDDYLVKHGREPIAGEVKSADPNFDPHADEDDHHHDEDDDDVAPVVAEDAEGSSCCQRP